MTTNASLITRLFDLDRGDPWLGQTVEGVKPLDLRKQIDDAWREEDHPRHEAGSESGGEFRAKGGGAASSDLQEMIHGDMSFTRGDDRQHVDSLDELYERCRKEEPQFIADVEALAKSSGGAAKFHHPTPDTILKPRASVERKLAEPEINGDVSKIRDVLRATIVHTSVEGSRLACAQFIKEQGDAVVRVKDRFVKPTQGYRDFLVNYRTPSGLVAEVQFNSRSMIKAKSDEGHKLYKRMGELLQRPADRESAQMLSTMVAQAEALYERAYKQDGNGNWAKK